MPIVSRPGDGDERGPAHITDDRTADRTQQAGQRKPAPCGKDARGNVSWTTIAGLSSGTMIRTPAGHAAIEELSPGDLVVTRDHAPQPIRWIGSRLVQATGDLAPMILRKDSVGNDRDLVVGPGHRILLCEWRAELMFGEPEVLASVRHLTDAEHADRQGFGEVELYQILFDNHEIVTANGAFCESYHPDEHGMHWLSDPAREEIFQLLRKLRTGSSSYGPLARRALRRHEIRAIQR